MADPGWSRAGPDPSIADAARSAGWRQGAFPGVWRRTLPVHEDRRGSFRELWRAEWTDALDPGAGPRSMAQANLSRSEAGVLRGLHVHRRQADLWVVADGHPFVALVDLRAAIAGHGDPVTATEVVAPGEVLYLPAGVAHGFYAPDPLTLLYLVTNAYDGTDELGFRWDDPDAGVTWPDPAPILSPRDAEAPALARLLDRLRAPLGQAAERAR